MAEPAQETPRVHSCKWYLRLTLLGPQAWLVATATVCSVARHSQCLVTWRAAAVVAGPSLLKTAVDGPTNGLRFDLL